MIKSRNTNFYIYFVSDNLFDLYLVYNKIKF